MASFVDEFNRSNYNSVGNGWLLANKDQNVGATADAWKIQSYRALPKTNTAISHILYRASPHAVGINVQYVWTVAAAIASGYSNNAECIFRFTATGGRGRDRLAVVLTGTTGTLQRRYQDPGQPQVGTVLATWSRIDDADYVITVDVSSADLITVYDTNFTGAGSKAAELTSTLLNDATGFGMGSGVFDKVQINDVAVPVYAIFTADPIDARVTSDARVELLDPAASTNFPAAQQRVTYIQVDPYSVIEGLPQKIEADQLYYAFLDFGTETVSDTGVVPLPSSIATSASQRWLPGSGLSGTTWASTPSGTRSWTRTTATEPNLVSNYTYSSPNGALQRDALDFNGAGFLRSAGTGTRAARSWSMGMVAVLHGGRGTRYSLLKTDQSAGNLGHALNLVYRHGEIFVQTNAKVASHEVKKSASTPVIVVLSVDNVTKKGRLLVQALSRGSKQFSLTGVDTADTVSLGLDSSNPTVWDGNMTAHQQLLEVDWWTRAITEQEMMRFVNQMSSVYGVAK